MLACVDPSYCCYILLTPLQCSITYEVNSTKTLDNIWRDDSLMDSLLDEWTTNKTGILVDTSENHIAWLRIPADNAIWANASDPASGPTTAHIEFLFQNGVYPTKDSGNYFNLPVGAVSPASRGFITINSSDPFAAPLIDPRLLSEPIDLLMVREGIKVGQQFVQAGAWEGYFVKALQDLETDEEIEEYVRENTVSFFHPVATAAMSPADADWGVVTPDLLVKGVKGLRIVDASVVVSYHALWSLSSLPDLFVASTPCRAHFCGRVWCGGEGSRHHQGGVP